MCLYIARARVVICLLSLVVVCRYVCCAIRLVVVCCLYVICCIHLAIVDRCMCMCIYIYIILCSLLYHCLVLLYSCTCSLCLLERESRPVQSYLFVRHYTRCIYICVYTYIS